MEKVELEKSLTEAVSSCSKADGWANLAEVGAVLRKQGIKYGKLSLFLDNYKYLVETRTDLSITPPAVYAKLRSTPEIAQVD